MARSIWSGTITFGHIEHLPHLAGRSGAHRTCPRCARGAPSSVRADTVVVYAFARALAVAPDRHHRGLDRRGVGVRSLSLTEPIETTSSTGRLLMPIVEATAEFGSGAHEGRDGRRSGKCPTCSSAD